MSLNENMLEIKNELNQIISKDDIELQSTINKYKLKINLLEDKLRLMVDKSSLDVLQQKYDLVKKQMSQKVDESVHALLLTKYQTVSLQLKHMVTKAEYDNMKRN